MFIDGFSLSGYRSFGNETQKVGPFGKVNLLAGQNNSGKSNILLFIKRNFPLLLNATREHGAAISAEELDQHRGNTVTNKNFGIGLNLSGPNYDAIMRKCNEGFKILPANYSQRDFEFALGLVDQILHSDALSQGGSTAWFTYSPPTSSNGIYELSQELVSSIYQEIVRVNREGAINHTWIALDYSRSRSYSGLGYEEMLTRILNFIAPHNLSVPNIHLIPAIRQIGESGSTYEDFSGFGIIKRLHELQSPGYNDQHLKVNF